MRSFVLGFIAGLIAGAIGITWLFALNESGYFDRPRAISTGALVDRIEDSARSPEAEWFVEPYSDDFVLVKYQLPLRQERFLVDKEYFRSLGPLDGKIKLPVKDGELRTDEGSVHRHPVYLERVVVIDDDKYFATPISVAYVDSRNDEPRVPRDIGGAIAELVRMLPQDHSEPAPTPEQAQSCALDMHSPDQIDGFAFRCGASLCPRLSETDRDPPCSFFVRLSDWIESAWLGGSCATSDSTADNNLVRSFRAMGVARCDTMSAVLINGLLLRLAHSSITPVVLVRLNLELTGEGM